ncbi:exodeoxyribonuclease V subunit gamma [Flammeovirga yaeyamensis]|uniref:DNA 3'-5' helicase n=1 Tax=Flammeovirga yaeyamensis TaxID=367791 RepID=A0AAX1N727_9BACT|nr:MULTISPECIES: UvrD-helicase domain-containing protein [Flammeovirga]ANQ49289.1 UvrD-helicase domain-containing protein [Flammeovirga sp. MY04]MBB3697848.1 DNA helicase-2/ATP-dependent DNA helicase PcrA [Flammeovirga yaeyamensis]NMF35796.1 UvrD-helicase domain-containing protein [Flammeovirga yaeyamensis]QWG03252.1 exodeoxyribonuclease V subunit gamma [Flammeovirga yaeyamensis]
MDYLEGLNPPQREAVVTMDGPMMIIAGAGSGKTRVLTYKIAHLIANGVEPFNILSLTFTNKASREMKERIVDAVGDDAKNLWMGTFHSVFARILRFEAEKIGYQSNFTIYDSEDAKSVIKGVVKDFRLDDKLYKPSVVLSRISSAKNNLISWRAYEQNNDLRLEDEASGRAKIAEIYKEYAIRCFRANAMDFDDLLFNTSVLFQQHLDVLNKYQSKFKYVLIDEFQDTNVTQYFITRKLAARNRNICVVGDDAQSIYAFRGANIQNILNFKTDYPELKVIKLEQNYRSTQTIVEAANSVIAHNKNQLEKNTFTQNAIGERIEVFRTPTDLEEARGVAQSIQQAMIKDHIPASDIAILYRTNSQSRALEEALVKLSIKAQIFGGLSFYQRKEIKDMIAYLKFVTNPKDEEAFKRIINYPKRGIGPTTVNNLFVKAAENKMGIWDIVANVRKFFGGRVATQVENFANMIKVFQMQSEQKNAFETASFIAKNSGILRELYDDKTPEGKNRYDNLQELLNGIQGFTDDPEKEDKSLTTYLEEISLITTQDKEDVSDAITLMTIHMSKGLEFDYVYLVGMEENLFPSQMMLETREDLEEERRLFYVAITRAKQRLYMSYALQRYRFGKTIMCDPSRFIDEIAPQYISMRRSSISEDLGPGSTPGFSNFRSLRQQPSNFIRKAVKPKDDRPFHPSNTDNLTIGQTVRHTKFGDGKVEKISDEGLDRRAIINFEEVGKKTLILTFAKLMILEDE